MQLEFENKTNKQTKPSNKVFPISYRNKQKKNHLRPWHIVVIEIWSHLKKEHPRKESIYGENKYEDKIFYLRKNPAPLEA